MENNQKNSVINKIGIIMLGICLLVAGLVVLLTIIKTEIETIVKTGNNIKTSYVEETSATNTWNISASESDNVTATLSDNGTLTISGTGKMKSWSYESSTEWHGMKTLVKTVVIESGVLNIGELAFYYCTSLTSIQIPDSVTNIGAGAFYRCESLVNIEIPDGVTNIGGGVFRDCTRLTSIEMPNGIKRIESNTFSDCISLTSIEIPDSVTSIELWAFSNCTRLTSIEIPKNVINIEPGAFSGCKSLIKIKVDEDNMKYCDEVGVLYTKNKTQIISYPPKRLGNKYVIPNGVTSIENEAFEFCSSLVSIEIPDTVKKIGMSAFSYCKNLTSIKIPDSVTNIGTYVFRECENLNIICKSGSIAEKYAKENKINYKIDNLPPTETDSENEYYIGNAQELWEFAQKVNNGNTFAGKTIYLTADINLQCSENNQWIPIGTCYVDGGNIADTTEEKSPFGGTFDGNNHVISGIYIDTESNYVGLFGYNQGLIQNLQLKDSYIKSKKAYIGGIAGFNKGLIINCHNYANVVTDTNSGACGGIAGYCRKADILDCSNKGRIEGKNGGVGGIIGFGFLSKISNCYNEGEIDSIGLSVGGIAGDVDSSEIENSYNLRKY